MSITTISYIAIYFVVGWTLFAIASEHDLKLGRLRETWPVNLVVSLLWGLAALALIVLALVSMFYPLIEINLLPKKSKPSRIPWGTFISRCAACGDHTTIERWEPTCRWPSSPGRVLVCSDACARDIRVRTHVTWRVGHHG